MDNKERELTTLGYLGLFPFMIGAIGGWGLIWVNEVMAFKLADAAIYYGAIIASYMAGMGAGAQLTGTSRSNSSLLPSMMAALVAWATILPNMFSINTMAISCIVLILVFVYLLMRDLRAVEIGGLPKWYGPLRQRLTFWVCIALFMLTVLQLLYPKYIPF
ncbi:MAG: DUF3429 domain-containing protein [Pseudomonadota bacterium]